MIFQFDKDYKPIETHPIKKNGQNILTESLPKTKCGLQVDT